MEKYQWKDMFTSSTLHVLNITKLENLFTSEVFLKITEVRISAPIVISH